MPLTRFHHFILSCWYKAVYASLFAVVRWCERLSRVCLYHGTLASEDYLIHYMRYKTGARPNTRKEHPHA